MCGIAGIYGLSNKLSSKKLLESMRRSLNHRGPDEYGYYRNEKIGLAHSRLSIIDISNGKQPFLSQGVCLIANAEIYNYKELIYSFNDYDFSTNSDCEVIIPLYKKYGLNFVDHLRGMYSIAIYDEEEDMLILSRDKFGIKPLYYYFNQNEFYFASELRAMLEVSIAKKRINKLALKEFLSHQYSLNKTTLVDGVQRVLPGETIVVKSGKIEKKIKHSPFKPSKKKKQTEARYLNDLDQALYESVSIHLRSDVPLGLFFSGGIDSTTLLIIMSEILDKPVMSYTATFESKENYESEHTNFLAKKYKSKNFQIQIDKNVFFENLPRVINAIDDPVADYAIVPTFLLAELAAKDLKVVLCGEGGDELFGGYGRYKKLMRPLFNKKYKFKYKNIFQDFSTIKKEFLLEKNYGDFFREQENYSKLQNAQLYDCEHWLPNDLLNKVDRCLMYHGLEGRTPFLDTSIVENSFNLPDKMKINIGRSKYLLRKWLEKKDIEAKPFEKKRGFTVPVHKWIHDNGEKLGELVSSQECIQHFAYSSKVKQLFKNNSKKTGLASWVLLFYSLWYKAHIQGIKLEGNVFDALSLK